MGKLRNFYEKVTDFLWESYVISKRLQFCIFGRNYSQCISSPGISDKTYIIHIPSEHIKDTAKDSVTTESLAAFILQSMSTPVEYD